MASFLRNAALGPTHHPEGMYSLLLSNLSFPTIRKAWAMRRQVEKVTLKPKGWAVAKVYFLGIYRFKLHLV